MHEKHVWEGELTWCAGVIVEDKADIVCDLDESIYDAGLMGKRVRITVEVLENGGGGAEEASRHEV